MRPSLEALLVRPVVAEITVFRIVLGGSPYNPGVLDSLRSNYDRGLGPRGAEVSSALIHMGLSTYEARARAVGIAQRWPRIGGYVAELRLLPEHGIWYAATGEPGHVTVWGRQRQLASCVVGILPVEDQQ